MSSSSRSESCGEMKSQNSSLQLGAQEGDEYSGSLCLDFGFKTRDVMTAAKLLDDAEVKQVEEYGFSTFLNLQLGTICERKETNLCMKLVDLEENRIKVQLQKDVIVYITPEEIHHLFRLPRGDKAPLKYNKQQQKDFAKLRAELGDPKMSLEIADILALMRREDKKHLRVKCFFLILFSKFLMPTTQQKINVNAVMYTQDMTSIKDYDFCAIVYEHLRESIRTWKARTLNKSDKSMTMPGCIIIILAYIVDNLKLMEIVDKKCPRINQYTMETLMRTIGNAKCHNGRISFDNFKSKALEETCYAESSRFYIQSPVDSQHSAVVTSGVPPVTQMPMPMQLLHQARGLLSAVQPVARSIGIDPEAVDECIAGLAQTGLTRSDAGASCSFSDGVFGNPTTEISGIAEDAEAAKTKKATVHEEETSCSFSDGVNGNPTTESSGIAEAARAAKTKKSTGRAQKSAPRKNAAEVGSKNPAGENAAETNPAETNPAPTTSRVTTRSMEAGLRVGGSPVSPVRPVKRQIKRK